MSVLRLNISAHIDNDVEQSVAGKIYGQSTGQAHTEKFPHCKGVSGGDLTDLRLPAITERIYASFLHWILVTGKYWPFSPPLVDAVPTRGKA